MPQKRLQLNTYPTPKRWFNIVAEAYNLQGDEYIVFVIVLFRRGFKFEYQPRRKLLPHFSWRLRK